MQLSEGRLPLWIATFVYAAASLAHHTHNAVHLAAYPNMPESLTTADVYFAWAAVTAVGLSAFVLMRVRRPRLAVWVLALYGACGWYGLAHYVVADFAAHSAGMHASILLEVIAGTVVVALAIRHATCQPASNVSRY